MLRNTAHFVIASITASFFAFASTPAEACVDIADTALAIIDAGTAVSNGASFFTTVQKDAFGYTSTNIKTLWGYSSPGSSVYYDKIVAGTHFTQITNVLDLAAGDVLVIDTTATYSGHTVMITDVPTELATALNPILSGTTQWALPIADATSSVHGCNPSYPDSRWPNGCTSGTFTGGAGTAYMRVYSDSSTNALLGHSWSVTSGGTYYSPTSDRPYAVGRLTPCPPL